MTDRRRARSFRPASKSCAIAAPDGQLAPARDPRRACRTRLAPHPDRRRRRHGLALPGRPLSRPAARRGRADHPRLPAGRASRCRRSSASTRRSARPCARTCSASDVLLDCDLSAQRVAGRPGENVDVTDPQMRAAFGQMLRGAAPASPPISAAVIWVVSAATSAQPANSASWIARSSGPNTQSGAPLHHRRSRNARSARSRARRRPARAPDRNPCRCADAR